MTEEKHPAIRGLLAGFALIILLLLALAGVGIYYLGTMNTAIAHIVDDHNRRAHLAAEMYIAARERALQLHAILEEEDPFARDALVTPFHELAGRFRGARAQLLAMPLSAAEQALLQEQGRYTALGSQLQDKVLDLALSEHKDAAESLLVREAMPAQDQAAVRLRGMMDFQEREGHRAAAEAKEAYRLARGLMLGSAGVALLLAMAIAAVVVTRQSRLMAMLRQNALDLRAQKQALDEHAIVSITDTAGRITYVNNKLCAISGYSHEELLGQNPSIVNSGLHPPEFFRDMWDTLAQGRVWHGEIRNRRKDGKYYWVDSTIVPFLDANGRPYQYATVCTDISARKSLEASLQHSNVELQRRVEERTRALSDAMTQLEADIAARKKAEAELKSQYEQLQALHRQLQDAQGQLLQSEKLASIGQLAAGVAHEINNPIGYVNSNLATLRDYVKSLLAVLDTYQAAEGELPEGARAGILAARESADLDYLKGDILALLEESSDGTARVRRIVQDLKDFSHVDQGEWALADLHKGLDSTLNVVHNEIKYKARVEKAYGDLPMVRSLPSQLNQVFMNLLVNAAHAIEGQGVITVRTAVVDDEARVEITDTGNGIPEHIQSRIFDPFFTTKPVGKGTGLGLSISYGIVRKHGGRIEVESTPGKGSTFRVCLPLHATENEEAEHD